GAGRSGQGRSGAWSGRGYAPPVNSNRARDGARIRQEYRVTQAPVGASLPALASRGSSSARGMRVAPRSWDARPDSTRGSCGGESQHDPSFWTTATRSDAVRGRGARRGRLYAGGQHRALVG